MKHESLENRSEKVLISPMALQLAVDSFEALSRIANDLLSVPFDSASPAPITSRATIGYFEDLSLEEITMLRDNLTARLTSSQYFIESYTRVLDTLIRKKLSE